MIIEFDGRKTDDVYLDEKEILITPKHVGSVTYALSYIEFIEEVIDGSSTVLKADFDDKKKVVTGLFI